MPRDARGNRYGTPDGMQIRRTMVVSSDRGGGFSGRRG